MVMFDADLKKLFVFQIVGFYSFAVKFYGMVTHLIDHPD